jgi:hypothetical protein
MAKKKLKLLKKAGNGFEVDNTRVNKNLPIQQDKKSNTLKIREVKPFAATGQIDYSPVNVEDFLMLPQVAKAAYKEINYNPVKAGKIYNSTNRQWVNPIVTDLGAVDNSIVRDFKPYSFENKDWYKEFGGQINKSDMTKNGKKIKLEKADPGRLIKKTSTRDNSGINSVFNNSLGLKVGKKKLNLNNSTGQDPNMDNSYYDANTTDAANFTGDGSVMQNPWSYTDNFSNTPQTPQAYNAQMPDYQLNERKWATPPAPTGMENSTEVKDLGNFQQQRKQSSGNGLSTAAQVVGYVNQGIKDAKKWTNDIGSLQQNFAVQGIENQQQRSNLISQYENPAPVISGGWGGFQPLEGTYVPVGAKYGAMLQKAEHGIPSKFTGNRHYEGGIPINTDIQSTNANDMKVNRGQANLEVEDKEYYVPSMQEGGKQQNSVVLSDRKNIGWNKMSPSENYEELTKAELGISADKFNKGITKNEKFKTDNIQFIDPIYGDKTQEVTKILSAPIVSTMQDLAHQTYVKQETVKKSKGMDNDLDSIMQSNQQPMAQYGAQIPDTEVYNVADMFMKNGGKLEKAVWGTIDNKKTLRGTKKGVEETYKSEEEAYKDYKRRGYKGAKDITKMREWDNAVNPQKQDAYINRTTPTNKHIKIWNDRVAEVNKERAINGEPPLPLAKDSKDVDLLQLSKEDRFAGYNDDKWDFRLNSDLAEPQIQPFTPKVKETLASSTPQKVSFDSKINTKSNQNGFNMPLSSFAIPNVYAKKPITSYDIAPQTVNPEVISPYVNDIQRLQFANTSNLGYSGAELANRSNMFGQGLTEYGKRYHDASVFNAQQRGQASQFNAQSLANNAVQNRANQWQTESAQNQRDGLMDTQFRTDQQADIQNIYRQNQARSTYNFIDKTNPWYKPTEDMLQFTPTSNDYSKNDGTVTTITDKHGNIVSRKETVKNSKFGGKINKLNTKKFKSKKK